jgi:hypothetical protein
MTSKPTCEIALSKQTTNTYFYNHIKQAHVKVHPGVCTKLRHVCPAPYIAHLHPRCGLAGGPIRSIHRTLLDAFLPETVSQYGRDLFALLNRSF